MSASGILDPALSRHGVPSRSTGAAFTQCLPDHLAQESPRRSPDRSKDGLCTNPAIDQFAARVVFKLHGKKFIHRNQRRFARGPRHTGLLIGYPEWNMGDPAPVAKGTSFAQSPDLSD